MKDDRRATELLRFGVVGLSGVGVNLGLYLLATRVLALSMHVASPLAIEASILWNFFWNDRWTFHSRTARARLPVRLRRFHLVSLMGGAINYATLVLFVTLLGVWDVAAALAGIGAGTSVNFAGNSFWTWREREAERLSHRGTRPAGVCHPSIESES